VLQDEVSIRLRERPQGNQHPWPTLQALDTGQDQHFRAETVGDLESSHCLDLVGFAECPQPASPFAQQQRVERGQGGNHTMGVNERLGDRDELIAERSLEHRLDKGAIGSGASLSADWFTVHRRLRPLLDYPASNHLYRRFTTRTFVR
jgi:hypothetical protein